MVFIKNFCSYTQTHRHIYIYNYVYIEKMITSKKRYVLVAAGEVWGISNATSEV